MRAARLLILAVALLGLGGCVAQIPTEMRARIRSVAVVSLLGSEVRHVDREWWQEPYLEEVCASHVGRGGRVYRRCWLETRYRIVSRILAVHGAALSGVDIDGAAPALLRERVLRSGAALTMLPARFAALPPGSVVPGETAAPELAPAVVERLRAIAGDAAAEAVLVLQGECAGPTGGCWAASLERSRPAGPYGAFSPWTSTSRFHAWLFDPVAGVVVARWSAPELRVVRAGVASQPPPPALPGTVGGALDPTAAQVAAQAIRFGLAELADDFACAMQGLRACPGENGTPARP